MLKKNIIFLLQRITFWSIFAAQSTHFQQVVDSNCRNEGGAGWSVESSKKTNINIDDEHNLEKNSFKN